MNIELVRQKFVFAPLASLTLITYSTYQKKVFCLDRFVQWLCCRFVHLPFIYCSIIVSVHFVLLVMFCFAQMFPQVLQGRRNQGGEGGFSPPA